MKSYFNCLTACLLSQFIAPIAFGSLNSLNRGVPYLKPVQIVQFKNLEHTTTELEYLKDCGDLFKGVFVREIRHTVQIGVVVERVDAHCSSLPVKERLYVPFRGSRRLVSVRIKSGQRIMLSEISEVVHSKSNFWVSWQDSCTPFSGVLLSPLLTDSRLKFGVSIAYTSIKSGAGQSCAREMKKIVLSSLEVSGDDLTLPTRPGDLNRLYSLQLKRPLSIQRNRTGMLVVTWEALCQEKFIGILFAGPERNEIAVLTGYAPNSDCNRSVRSQNQNVVSQLSVRRGLDLFPISDTNRLKIKERFHGQLQLGTLSSVQLAREGSEAWTSATVADSCSETIGLVVGSDLNGNLAMAPLLGGQNRICNLHQIVSFPNLSLPLMAERFGPAPKVFSLKVFGTGIN